jgi:hypothetical protein
VPIHCIDEGDKGRYRPAAADEPRLAIDSQSDLKPRVDEAGSKSLMPSDGDDPS